MENYSLEDLLYLMSRLRDPQDGCPWDTAQDFSSIVPHTIEESYELADAIASGDIQHIREELGDVLFQVIFCAQLGAEQEHFDFSGIVSSLVEKLLRRHPHVFPDGSLRSRMGVQQASTASIKQNWENLKIAERREKQLNGVLDDIPSALPALTRAAKIQKRASKTGFDWSNADGVLLKLQEEISELVAARLTNNKQEIEGEIGDILFTAVNLARHVDVDPESALRITNKKFEARFRYIEKALQAAGSSTRQASVEEMDMLWDEAKQQGL
ncbi:MAG: nucleoside triphosphate pyrophosphohydrolase [Oceanicoccus sp.]